MQKHFRRRSKGLIFDQNGSVMMQETFPILPSHSSIPKLLLTGTENRGIQLTQSSPNDGGNMRKFACPRGPLEVSSSSQNCPANSASKSWSKPLETSHRISSQITTKFPARYTRVKNLAQKRSKNIKDPPFCLWPGTARLASLLVNSGKDTLYLNRASPLPARSFE